MGQLWDFVLWKKGKMPAAKHWRTLSEYRFVDTTELPFNRIVNRCARKPNDDVVQKTEDGRSTLAWFQGRCSIAYEFGRWYTQPAVDGAGRGGAPRCAPRKNRRTPFEEMRP